MKSHANKILESIKQALTEHLPKGGKALLFGSQARGDARIDSDWDILIILDKEKLEPEDYDKVSFPLTMLGWDLGARINPIMYTMKEWAASCITPFYKNVEQEPIFITKNGYSDLVVMSSELYDKFASTNRIDQAIFESEQEIANGAEAADAEVVFAELEKKQCIYSDQFTK